MTTPGFGTFDGSGDSGGRTTKVSCSHCNTENEVQDDDVRYTPFSRFIICKSCEEEIVLEDDSVGPASTSILISGSMSITSEQQLERESDDGRQDEGVERVGGLRLRGRDRKLKSRVPHSECVTERNGPMTIQQSASLGTTAQNGSGLTVSSLKKLSEMIKKQPCSHCGCAERDLLKPVEGISMLFHCLSCKNLYGIDDGMMIQQSASLGAIAQTGSSELTVDSLMQLSEMIKEQPCPRCGCAERGLLIPVEGIRDLFNCLRCKDIYGIDDGMNFFDFQEFLSTGYRMHPCSLCGNDDPEKFTLERSSTGQMDSTTDLVVQCSVCKIMSPRGLGQVAEQNEEDLGAAEVSSTMKCSSCGNRDLEKFEVQLDSRNSTIETICMVCKSRIVTEVTGQICCCKEASVDYGFDEYGYICKIKCDICGAAMETNDDARNKSSSDGSSWGRTRIRNLDMIRAGDHVAWHQGLGYWHHAIVVEVQGSFINLINYNGPSAHKGEIVDEWRELDPTMEAVYRIDYHRDAGTYDPKVVVERARSKLGEHSYNLLKNSCEHFARWCVTGQHRSVQVQTFYEAILNQVKVAAKGTLVQSLTKLGKRNLKFAAQVADSGLVLGQNLVMSGDNVAMETGTEMFAGAIKSVPSRICSKMFAVGYEIYSAITDIRLAHHQMVEGAIGRNEFLKVTIKRSCEGVGLLVGTAVTLAIPVANSFVGLTMATIIGKTVGGMIGRNAACLIDKVSTKS